MSLTANIIKAIEKEITSCFESVKLDNQENNGFLTPMTDSTYNPFSFCVILKNRYKNGTNMNQ